MDARLEEVLQAVCNKCACGSRITLWFPAYAYDLLEVYSWISARYEGRPGYRESYVFEESCQYGRYNEQKTRGVLRFLVSSEQV